MGDGGAEPRPCDFYAATPAPTTTLPPPTPPTPAPPSAPKAKRWTVLGAVVALIVVAAVIRVQAMHHGGAFSWGDASGSTTMRAFGGAPPAKETANPQRLLPAVTTTPSAGGYTFDATDNGRPVRWDPCRPIHYVVSGTEPFAGANQLLTQTLDEAGAASGLQFADDGRTTEPAMANRASYQPDRYGQRWAPVLIAWTDEGAVPQLADNVIGLGGAAAASVHGTPRLVSGIVYFDAPELSLIALRPDGYASMRTVMLHEVGHLLGLGHVQVPSEVMYPSNAGQGDYGPGDRAGLAIAGSAPCSRWG